MTVYINATGYAEVGPTTNGTLGPSITTTETNTVIVVFVNAENGGSAAATVSTVSGLSLTWTKKASYAASGVNVEIWYAVAAATVTGTVTITMSGTVDGVNSKVIAFSGVNTTTPWDSNASLPATIGSGATTSISTTTKRTYVLNLIGVGASYGTAYQYPAPSGLSTYLSFNGNQYVVNYPNWLIIHTATVTATLSSVAWGCAAASSFPEAQLIVALVDNDQTTRNETAAFCR